MKFLLITILYSIIVSSIVQHHLKKFNVTFVVPNNCEKLIDEKFLIVKCERTRN